MGKALPRAVLLLFPLLLPFPAAQAQPVSVTDDRGKAVKLARPAQRIVALAPALAELAHAAGAGKRLVGVTRHSDFPPEVLSLPEVGDSARLDFERIAVLKPDLVLAWRSGNLPAHLERLEQLGFRVWAGEPRRLADIARHLRAIGTLAGTRPAAERSAADFERGIANLTFDHAFSPRVRVFYEISRKPLMTVSGAHLISDVISACGGENVFADASQLAPVIGAEALIAAKPQAVIGGTRSGGDPAYAREWRAQAPAPLRSVPVFYVDPDLIHRATPRMLEGAQAVCAALEAVRKKK